MRVFSHKSFQERNLLVIAIVGLVGMVVVFGLVFNAASLPIIGGGTTYHAAFAEAGGLKNGDPVRIAGVKVGQVSGMRLDGDRIMVDFKVEHTWVGDASSATIAIKTLLGQKYLQLDSEGHREMPAGGTIPLGRTTAPYDVTQTLSKLSTTVGKIDTKQLEDSFAALSNTFQNTPSAVRGTLTGLTALSRTVTSRDQQIAELLENTRKISAVLSQRRAQVADLVQDGNLLLAELQKRREVIAALLKGTAEFGTQLRGLVSDNQSTLRPALAKLDTVADILNRNQANLDNAVRLLGPYYRVLTSALGNGRWIDTYACGLFDSDQYPQLENDVARNCSPAQGGGR